MAHKPSFSFLVSLLVLGGAVAVHAGMPEKVVYQGRLSRSGAAVSSSQQIKVTLIDPNGVESPQIVFSSLVPLAATGEFSVLLNMPPNYDWERAAPELEIEVGGEVLTPREQINVSPYAFLAKKVAVGGVSSPSIGAGQVLDVHVSTISAAKIMLPGTASPITVWQSTVAGQLDKIDSAKVYGSILSAPASHGASHGAGNTDPINNLQPTQVVGTAIVGSKGTPQTIQATANVVPLAVKPNPTVAAGGVNVLEIYDNVPSASMFIRGDGIVYFRDNVGVGTSSPTAKLDVQGTVKATAVEAGTVTVTTMTVQKITPAPWHIVGAAGEPAFGSAWESNGGGWSAVSFQKDAAGWVRFRGMAKAKTSYLWGDSTGVIFTLPLAFRPNAASRFGLPTYDPVSGSSVQFLDIDAAGLVRLSYGTNPATLGSAGTTMPLDGVAFQASN